MAKFIAIITVLAALLCGATAAAQGTVKISVSPATVTGSRTITVDPTGITGTVTITKADGTNVVLDGNDPKQDFPFPPTTTVTITSSNGDYIKLTNVSKTQVNVESVSGGSTDDGPALELVEWGDI